MPLVLHLFFFLTTEPNHDQGKKKIKIKKKIDSLMTAYSKDLMSIGK